MHMTRQSTNRERVGWCMYIHKYEIYIYIYAQDAAVYESSNTCTLPYPE